MYRPNAHAFADDTQLYISFNPDNSLSEAEAARAMEQCIRAISGAIRVGDTSVAIVKQARNVGVWFDSQPNFNVHITKTCSLSFCSLYKIRRIRKYLSYKSTQTRNLSTSN